MELGTFFLVFIFLAFLVWIMVGIKSHQHKGIAIFLIVILLFAIIGFNIAFKGKEIHINNISDLRNVIKIYFSWLGSAFNNVKILTAQAIKMNWQGNKTIKLT